MRVHSPFVMCAHVIASLLTGRHKDGSLIPLLMSSSQVTVGGNLLYSLLFERTPPRTAIITADMDGVVQSATINVLDILGYSARELAYRPLDMFIKSPSGGIGYLSASVGMIRARVPVCAVIPDAALQRASLEWMLSMRWGRQSR